MCSDAVDTISRIVSEVSVTWDERAAQNCSPAGRKRKGQSHNRMKLFCKLNSLRRCCHHQLLDTIIAARVLRWCGGLGFMIARLSTVVILQLWLAHEEETCTSVKMLAGELRSLCSHSGWQPHSKHDAGNGSFPAKRREEEGGMDMQILRSGSYASRTQSAAFLLRAPSFVCHLWQVNPLKQALFVNSRIKWP